MRSVERSNSCYSIQARVAEVHHNVWDGYAVGDCFEQALFEPVGLRLHTVDEYTPTFLSIAPSALVDVAGRGVPALAWVRRRKDLFALAS
jgi:hypothetical protein